jgi:hypothetical protein
VIDIRVRCLQVVGDEGQERTFDIRELPLDWLLEAEHAEAVALPRAEGGPIRGHVRAGAERMDGLIKLRVRVENVTPLPDANNPPSTRRDATRQEMLSAAFVGTHALVAVRGGRFVSLIDPPEGMSAAAASCRNLHVWPVLIGDSDSRDMLLSAPIILYDFPTIAPESRTELFDATEIDEILALRVLTLTDVEKSEARATDPHAADIVNRVESMTADDFDALHGAWRDLLNPVGEPSPEEATANVGGVTIGRGSRVIVRPQRRADSMDLLIAGRTARVEGVYRDVDDRVLVAVVLVDDPAGALHAEMRRYFYYGPEELEPAG